MKKLTASIIAGALMISSMGINAFAAETATPTPKITVYGNESSPVAIGDETSFIVRLSDFKDVKGMDITITSKDKQVAFTAAKMDKGVTLTEGKNVKVDANKIHIVDLTTADMQNGGYANITVTAKVNGADTINVTGTLAKNGKETIGASYTVGKAAVKTLITKTTASAGEVKASDEEHFIPYGFFKNGDKYILKEKDGSFKNVPEGQEYAEYVIPENGITTFAASDHLTENTIQFGTYTNQADDKANTRGTLLFEGNWEAFKNYYITEKGFSVNEILEKVNNAYDNALNAKSVDKDMDGIKVDADNISVVVRRVEQTKAMWKVNGEPNLQYAARLENAKSGRTYTAVGYLKANGTGEITFSENMVTSIYGSNNG